MRKCLMIRESIRNKMVCVYTDTIIKQKKHYTDKNVIFFLFILG